MTPAALAGMVKDQLKELTGCTAEQFKEQRLDILRLKEAAEAPQRTATQDLALSSMPPNYLRKARHVIASDPGKGMGLMFARMARCLALSKLKSTSGPQVDARDVAKTEYDDPDLAKAIDDIGQQQTQLKTLTANAGTAGGFLVPNEYATEMIELLRAEAVMRGAGIRVVPMRTGTMSMPRQSGAATAGYGGEAANITSSQITVDQLQLMQRKLTALTPVSNDLLRESNPAADAIVRDDLVKVMALREDLGFIRDDGTSNKPKGLRYRTATANINHRTAASPPATLAEITSDLFAQPRLLHTANVKLKNPFWIMHARTMWNLRSKRDSLGNLVFDPEMRTGKLLGFPYFVENQIPTNLTVNSVTNSSEVYFAEATELLIGDTLSLAIEVFPGGAYYDGSAVQSGISQDLTIIRAIAQHDFIMRHPQGCAIIDNVDW
jgi:HK97 family phage major capsid protein